MRSILLLMASVLILAGPARAGELKVMVPVDEFKQMSSRLDALESENSQLKRQLGVAATGQDSAELQNRVDALEAENLRLKQSGGEVTAQPSAEMQARLSQLERENSELKASLLAKEGEVAAPSDADNDRMAAMINENSQLKQEVNALREGGALSLTDDTRSARQAYFPSRRKANSHNFIF